MEQIKFMHNRISVLFFILKHVGLNVVNNLMLFLKIVLLIQVRQIIFVWADIFFDCELVGILLNFFSHICLKLFPCSCLNLYEVWLGKK